MVKFRQGQPQSNQGGKGKTLSKTSHTHVDYKYKCQGYQNSNKVKQLFSQK
uniref:Uncharacterized protein n=1 Tax=Rhizophora mucronata TaxID=61149 RepID=A0A2P2QU69_RHIMU